MKPPQLSNEESRKILEECAPWACTMATLPQNFVEMVLDMDKITQHDKTSGLSFKQAGWIKRMQDAWKYK